MEQKPQERYLTHMELRQFKMDCPLCGLTLNLIQFSEHLVGDVCNFLKRLPSET